MGAPTESTSGDAQTKESMKILIIDDEPYVEALVKGWFRGTSYQFDYLANGEPLMHNGASMVSEYDLVLLDKQMPEVDGLELGKRLRELYPNLVTVMVTGVPLVKASATGVKVKVPAVCPLV